MNAVWNILRQWTRPVLAWGRERKPGSPWKITGLGWFGWAAIAAVVAGLAVGGWRWWTAR